MASKRDYRRRGKWKNWQLFKDDFLQENSMYLSIEEIKGKFNRPKKDLPASSTRQQQTCSTSANANAKLKHLK